MNNVSVQLSIVVPVYNVEKWLDECLASIYAIQLGAFEVIIINDGSTDNSATIIQRYAELYPAKSTVINQENQGLSFARNAGINAARGDYIAFIDSDDVIDPDRFVQLFKFTRANKLDVGCANGIRFLDGKHDTGPISNAGEHFNSGITYTGGRYLNKALAEGVVSTITVWDKLYKREFLNQHDIRFIDKIKHEDVPFTVKVFLYASTVKYLDVHFYRYRIRSGSIMHTLNESSALSRLFVTNNLLELTARLSVNALPLNDYLVYQVKRASEHIVIPDSAILVRLLIRKLSVKKRILLLTIIAKRSVRVLGLHFSALGSKFKHRPRETAI